MRAYNQGMVGIRLEERPRGLVAHVTIDNESKLNALSSELMGQFIEEMERLATIDRLRVVILTGAGLKAFVGGADIKEMAELNTPCKAKALSLHASFHQVRLHP